MKSLKLSGCLCSVGLLALGCATSLSAAEALYQTSFEDGKPGRVEKLGSGSDVVWESAAANVTSKYFRTGKQSLHLDGGKDQVTTLTLSGKAQKARGLTFWGERWTSGEPFRFKVEAVIDGKLVKLADLDHVMVVGERFQSKIVLAIPEGEKVEQIKFTLTAPEAKGLLMDDFALLAQTPEKVTEIPVMAPIPTEPLKLISDAQVFVGGEDETHTYRIPAIITAKNGDLIAACDARRKNGGDLYGKNSRNIDIVVKRSTDNGKTWGPMEVVVDYPDGTGGTDPSLVMDRTTGDIFIFYSYMGKVPSKEFFFRVHRSKDNGKTWSKYKDITKDISKPEWKNSFKFISSGRGSQMENGTLIHNYVILKHGVNVFGSTDHGKTWKLMVDSGIKPADESRVLELTDGRLMVNSRVPGGMRWVHLSGDRGKTWENKREVQLPDPTCNGAILRYTSKKDGYAKDRLLFCNAASRNGRKNLTVRISYDEGKTWSAGKVVDPGPSAYSELTILKDGTIGAFYEPGYRSLRFVRFSLEDLTDGKDKLTKPYEIK